MSGFYKLPFKIFQHRFRAAVLRHKGQLLQVENGALIAKWMAENTPQFAFLSGLHGDEVSGPLALLYWLETLPLGTLTSGGKSVWIAPLLNDVGWDANQREWNGIDLNRAFTEAAPPFLASVMQNLTNNSPDFFLDLHEDSEKDHAYIFKFSPDKTGLSRQLAHELEAKLVRWSSLKKWKGSSEVFVRSLGCQYAATTEAPPLWPLEKRVAWQSRAINFFFKNFDSKLLTPYRRQLQV